MDRASSIEVALRKSILRCDIQFRAFNNGLIADGQKARAITRAALRRVSRIRGRVSALHHHFALQHRMYTD